VTQHAISAGHYLAATAGFDVLQAGGNAVDAGCAAGSRARRHCRAISSTYAGVRADHDLSAEKQEVVTIAGLGPWPRTLDPELFLREHGGKISERCVADGWFPRLPNAWITALRRYGTMGFG